MQLRRFRLRANINRQRNADPCLCDSFGPVNSHRPFFIPVEQLRHPLYDASGVDVMVLRADLIDPVTGGNKWFKLHFYLEQAREQELHTLVSMGGAFSNHLAALARAGKENGLHTIGYVRGEEPPELNTTLRRAKADGMELRFVSRAQFREMHDWQTLPKELQVRGAMFIPEGGASVTGMKGAALLADFVPEGVDSIVLPTGTGTTLAGLLASGLKDVHLVGVSTVNAANYPESSIRQLLHDGGYDSQLEWEIWHDYTFGGFGKHPKVLRDFCAEFMQDTKLPIEPVYTGKMLFALHDQLAKHAFAPGSRILLVHTGGLQYLPGVD